MLPATPLSNYRFLEDVLDLASPPSPPLLVRPLLEVPSTEIERYCVKHGLKPRFDRSNLDTTYFRNRLRHELIPLLESCNPNLRRCLRHTAQVVGADYALLEQLRDRAWERVVLKETEEAIVLDREAWAEEHLSLKRALIRRAAYRLRPSVRDVDFVHVENAVRVATEGETGAQSTLPGGLMLNVGYDRLTVASAEYQRPLEGPTLPSDVEMEVALPGTTPLPEEGWSVEAALPEEWSLAEVEANPDQWTAYLDTDALGEPLILRTRRTGDRFNPQGMGDHAPRLTDWMINAKIPRHWREQLPLLVAGGDIVWVCGWRVSESALVHSATRQAARFRFQEVDR
jgi:tRNA(Ile)-lysidine synthase